MFYNNIFKLYGKIPSDNGEIKIINRLLHSSRRYLIRTLATKFILPNLYRRKKNLSKIIARNTIISLTSFPKRFHTLWLVIESLKHQTIRPEKIILYLSTDEVKSKTNIPQSLLNEEDDIFEIRLRDGKFRAHGKYYFAMSEFPTKNVVTVDDDIIYPPSMLQSLLNGHKKYPNNVITNCSKQILFDTNNIAPYTKWKQIFNSNEYKNGYCEIDNLIPMGVGGVLYPPKILYKDLLNFDLAKSLSFLADDLWLYSQTILAGRKIIKTQFNTLMCLPIEIEDNVTLSSANVANNQNDVQFKQLRNYYINQLKIDIVKGNENTF